MNSYSPFILSAVAGMGLGLVFYGGLYLTVTHGLRSPRPGLWFFGSFLLRMSLVLTGLYFVSEGQWQRIIACLSGFIVTGVVFQVWKAIPPSTEKVPIRPLSGTSEKAHHAP